MAECQTMGDCDAARLERIYEYLDGALSPQDAQAVKDHLQQCEQCQDQCSAEELIRHVLKRSCCEKAPQDLKERIMQALETPASR